MPRSVDRGASVGAVHHIDAMTEPLWVTILVTLGLIGTLIAIAVTTYGLTEHLGEGLPILWAVAMCIPCANIFGLLVISAKAQTWCKQYGIKVGLLGPTQKSIEEVRRRTFTSAAGGGGRENRNSLPGPWGRGEVGQRLGDEVHGDSRPGSGGEDDTEESGSIPARKTSS